MRPFDIFRLFTTTAAATLLILGCISKDDVVTDSVKGSSLTGSKGASLGPKAWSYSDSTGPEHWANLCSDYELASNGRKQSPVNIVREECTSQYIAPINYSYTTSHIHLFNNGHTIQANLDNGQNYISVGDRRYNLQQFHFHTQSEHTLNGEHAPIEMHLVHRDDFGGLAVVGVLINEGEENKTLEELWENLPQKHEIGYYTKKKIEISELIPENQSSFRYTGSLTTPPCTEDVEWAVMAEALEMSKDQIYAFTGLFDGAEFPEGNRRPVQPLNSRSIILDIQE